MVRFGFHFYSFMCGYPVVRLHLLDRLFFPPPNCLSIFRHTALYPPSRFLPKGLCTISFFGMESSFLDFHWQSPFHAVGLSSEILILNTVSKAVPTLTHSALLHPYFIFFLVLNCLNIFNLSIEFFKSFNRIDTFSSQDSSGIDSGY